MNVGTMLNRTYENAKLQELKDEQDRITYMKDRVFNSIGIFSKYTKIKLIILIVIAIIGLVLLKKYVIKNRLSTFMFITFSIFYFYYILLFGIAILSKRNPYNRIFTQQVNYLNSDNPVYNKIENSIPEISYPSSYFLERHDNPFDYINIHFDNHIYSNISYNSSLYKYKNSSSEKYKKYTEDEKLIEGYIKDEKEYLNNLTPLQKEVVISYQNTTSYPIFTKFLNKTKQLLNPNAAALEYPNFQFIYDMDPSIFDSNDLRVIMNKISKMLNDIIVKAPKTPTDLLVFRGTKDPYFMDQLTKEGDDYIYTNHSVMSTTFNFWVMTVENSPYMAADCCISIIHIPKGTTGVYLNKFGGIEANLAEFLLPIGSKLRLRGFTKNYIHGKNAYEWDYIPPTSTEYVELYKY